MKTFREGGGGKERDAGAEKANHPSARARTFLQDYPLFTRKQIGVKIYAKVTKRTRVPKPSQA